MCAGCVSRWTDEQYSSYPIDFLNGPVPSPDGPVDDPALVQDIASVRAALNNYYIAHARNLGLTSRSRGRGTVRRPLLVRIRPARQVHEQVAGSASEVMARIRIGVNQRHQREPFGVEPDGILLVRVGAAVISWDVPVVHGLDGIRYDDGRPAA